MTTQNQKGDDLVSTTLGQETLSRKKQGNSLGWGLWYWGFRSRRVERRGGSGEVNGIEANYVPGQIDWAGSNRVGLYKRTPKGQGEGWSWPRQKERGSSTMKG